MDQAPDEPVVGLKTERRISWLTLLIGFSGGALALALREWRWAAGLTIGAILAWLNFRWLRRGLDGLVASSRAQHGSTKPRVPAWTYLLLMFRYGLLASAVYAIFVYLKVPLLSMVVGLCALGAAALAASVWEILRPAD